MSTEAVCCPNCFGDVFLSAQIGRSGCVGRCHYCASVGMPVAQPMLLRDHFELLLGVYREDRHGVPLVDLLRSDWDLFRTLRPAPSNKLLAEILDDGDAVRKRYVPCVLDDGSALEQWDCFREELKHENRFFPRRTPDLARLGELLTGHLLADPASFPSVLYRSRIAERDAPFAASEMGKPPADASSSGRANPIGIPYLYLASDVHTAVAEVRPHTGERVCVAEFRLGTKQRIADLRNPRRTISPFTLSDEDAVAQLRNDIAFLCQLGEELTRPVTPKSASLEYLPSQYLCEFAKHLGFTGVMYRSSVADGVNYAIFDESLANVGNVVTYTVSSMTLDLIADAAPHTPNASNMRPRP